MNILSKHCNRGKGRREDMRPSSLLLLARAHDELERRSLEAEALAQAVLDAGAKASVGVTDNLNVLHEIAVILTQQSRTIDDNHMMVDDAHARNDLFVGLQTAA